MKWTFLPCVYTIIDARVLWAERRHEGHKPCCVWSRAAEYTRKKNNRSDVLKIVRQRKIAWRHRATLANVSFAARSIPASCPKIPASEKWLNYPAPQWSHVHSRKHRLFGWPFTPSNYGSRKESIYMAAFFAYESWCVMLKRSIRVFFSSLRYYYVTSEVLTSVYSKALFSCFLRR